MSLELHALAFCYKYVIYYQKRDIHLPEILVNVRI